MHLSSISICDVQYSICVVLEFYICCASFNNTFVCADKRCTYFVQGNGSKKKKPFTLMHCYVEFSKYPKWQTRKHETSLKKQKKTGDASPGTATNDLANVSSVRTDATSIRTDALEHEKRPDGVKKDKGSKADDSAWKLSLETVWAAKQEKDAIKVAARNVRYAQQFELRKEEIALKKKEDARNEREDSRRQFELDERVMLMDTSGMTDVQKQFYQAKQNEILARRLE